MERSLIATLVLGTVALFGAVAVQKNIRDIAQFNRAHPELEGSAE